MATSPTVVDDLATVELRRRVDRPGDAGGPRGDDWQSSPATRHGAVRRPGTSFTLPQLTQVRLVTVVKVVVCSRGGGAEPLRSRRTKNIDSVLHTKTTFQAHSTSISSTWSN